MATVAAVRATRTRYWPLLLTLSCSCVWTMRFDEQVFSTALRTKVIGQKIYCHSTVPSTMKLATDLISQQGAQSAHGSLVLAEAQSSGIGRRGRAWQDDESCSLLFSLVWSPSGFTSIAEAMPQLVRLNLAAPVAVVRACAGVGVNDAKVKWPNDVLVGKAAKKLCGVLLDFNGQDAAVLGVGINVLQDMCDHPTATSVSTLLASAGSAERATSLRERLLASFCTELEVLMHMSNDAVVAEHGRHHLLEGRTVRVHHASREEVDERDYDAKVLGVNPDGQLRVRPLSNSTGVEMLLSGEEVSITAQ